MSFNNWPIRLKLSGGFGTLIVICAIIGLLGVTTTSRFAGMISEMHDNSLQQVVGLAEIHDMVLDHNRDLLALLLDQEQSFHLLDHLNETRVGLEGKLASLHKEALTPSELSQLAIFEREWADYLRKATKALELGLQEHGAEALKFLGTDVNPTFLAAEEKLILLIDYNNNSAHEILETNRQLAKDFVMQLFMAMIAALGAGIFLAWRCTRAIVAPIRMAADINSRLAIQSSTLIGLADAIANGDLRQEIPHPEKFVIPKEIIHGDETGTLLQSAQQMSNSQLVLTRAMSKMGGILSQNQEIEKRRDWLKSGINNADELLRGDKHARQLAGEMLPFLVSYLGAAVGALYLYDRAEETLYLATTWALPKDFRPKEQLRLGEGLLGQAAQERRAARFCDMPADYLPVTSALGSVPTCEVVAQPLVHDGELFGALELGSLQRLPEDALELLGQIAGNLALALKVARSREQIGDLLEQAQQQAEELRVQQEELQQSNEELEERAQLLEQQRAQIGAQNREIEATSEQLRHKADELERISAYKSEFLANMSHELRSPLNSLLILSSLLQDNREGNLTEKQVKFATTINNAGKDLLALINDILDLSKVEAGKLQLHCEPTPVRELCADLRALCQPQFEAKGLPLKFNIADDVTGDIDTDRQRLQQILRNLLANACKFTDQGEVIVTVRNLRPGEGGLRAAGLAFEVRDTGIGIATDKQQLIFEAFQQEDGSTSRKYGGTGLGLSIALQLARRMGGNIRLASIPGQGSTFTLNLPLQTPAGDASETVPTTSPVAHREAPAPVDPQEAAADLPQPLADDRAGLNANDRTILIIEDDLAFAGLLAEMVRARRFKVLVAADGENGIAMADRYQPSAIILDIMLPHIDGWAVMRHLKDNPRTRHIPVHFVTCLDEAHKALGMGAVGYIRKPVTPEQLDEVLGTIEHAVEQTGRRLLIVEDSQHEAEAMVALLNERNVEITVVPSGRAAIEELGSGRFDCIVLDLGLADTTGFTLLEHLRAQPELRRIPVIIHSGQELSREDELRLRRFTESIIIKGARSPDRLLNEVTLFLHLVESGLSPGKQQMIREVLDKEAMLAGKRILIVDDDMRNIFSLSNILAEKQLTIFEAENGREALARLDEHPEIDLVLMDIMMPEMDGYEAIRVIRRDQRFRRLPVIAMTAKALKGDQEKCLEAGASDYLSKPIDPDKLFSLLRVWLYPGSLP